MRFATKSAGRRTRKQRLLAFQTPRRIFFKTTSIHDHRRREDCSRAPALRFGASSGCGGSRGVGGDDGNCLQRLQIYFTSDRSPNSVEMMQYR
jgi:hypothetical protein